LTFVNQAGIRFMGFDDVFMLNLFDQTQDLAWANMNNAQRAFSSINTGALVWSGSAVAAGAGGISQGSNGGLLRLLTWVGVLSILKMLVGIFLQARLFHRVWDQS